MIIQHAAERAQQNSQKQFLKLAPTSLSAKGDAQEHPPARCTMNKEGNLLTDTTAELIKRT